jgi:hypothetical protein
VTGSATPLQYFVSADFPHQMSYLRPALLYVMSTTTRPLLLEEVFIQQKVATGEYYVVDRYHFKYFWELKPKIVINNRT